MISTGQNRLIQNLITKLPQTLRPFLLGKLQKSLALKLTAPQMPVKNCKASKQILNPLF